MLQPGNNVTSGQFERPSSCRPCTIEDSAIYLLPLEHRITNHSDFQSRRDTIVTIMRRTVVCCCNLCHLSTPNEINAKALESQAQSATYRKSTMYESPPACCKGTRSASHYPKQSPQCRQPTITWGGTRKGPHSRPGNLLMESADCPESSWALLQERLDLPNCGAGSSQQIA